MIDRKRDNYGIRQYFEEIIKESIDVFNELTRWSDDDMQDFSLLLTDLKSDKCKTTKEKGNKLEKLVEFIIKKTFFFDVYSNVRTGTNEIDEIITLSSKGKQALEKFGICKDLLEVDSDVTLGECKNYGRKLGVTYIGKFYSLMISTNVSFGIIFTTNGLTGNEKEFRDSYGLIKVLRIIEKYKNNNDDFYIITFDLSDYEKMQEGTSFFELIKAKKFALRMSANYDQFLQTYEHSETKTIKSILDGRC